MRESYFHILTILRSFINEDKPVFDHVPDWETIFRLSSHNSLGGIVGYVVLMNQLCSNEKMQEKWLERCSNTYGLSYRRNAQFGRMSKMLSDNEIDHLIVKGAVMKEYYPVKELRTFSDIDLLIKTKDRNKLHRLMLEHGYESPIDWEPIYSYKRDTEYYEIHTNIMYENPRDDFDYSEYFSHSWERAIKKSSYLYELKPEDHLIYLMTHLAKHVGNAGAGIRMYLDLALFIKNSENHLDWTYISNELNKIKLNEFSSVVYSALERWFSTVITVQYTPASDQLLDQLLDRTIHGGTFGFGNQSSGVVMLQNTENDENIPRMKLLMNRTFPSAETLEARYPYLEGRHWLLPVAWVERFYQSRKKLKKNLGDAKDIIMTDKKQIEEIRKFKKEIGLL